MRLLHTADLHLGQILYQYYDRMDEHIHFFNQLEKWIDEMRPDALIISGDIFDVAQPSAATWKFFTNAFVAIRRKAPDMHIVIIAGNHDSASRLQAHSEIWALASTTVIGTPPPPVTTEQTDWLRNYIVELPQGFIIALPYMSANRSEHLELLQAYVRKLNKDNLPVVMTGHLTVTGADLQGHSFDIGNLRNTDLSDLGDGYDYLALGHIHRPQTIGHPEDSWIEEAEYDSPVARYSGSPLHVGCDETYPHSASLVDIDRLGGTVKLRQLKVDQLRHFKVLPESGNAFESEKDALAALKKYSKKGSDRCYLRLRFKDSVILPADFNNKVYDILEASGKDLRYNPRHIRVADSTVAIDDDTTEEIPLETLTQMENPLDFIRMNASRFPDLSMKEMEEAFEEIEKELEALKEESR